MQPVRTASRAAIVGWVLFDWAAQPFFTLIITFVYAPYFASAIAANPVEGQALWGFATAAAGLVVAALSPVLGSIADAGGRRKPWIAAFGVLVVFGSAMLWFGRPGDASVIPLVLCVYAIGVIGVEFAGVFNNAMMPSLVPPEQLGRLSGTGWATGYVGGLLSLLVVLGFLAGNPQTGKTLFGFMPLFGLDPAMREGDRAVGPLTAIWFVVFILPLFLFTPDRPPGLPIRAAVRSGIAMLAETVRNLPRHRNTAIFLLANMIYADGMVALFAFGGIYAAGTFGWGTIQIGIFGILLNVAATLGAYLGGKLDDRLGPKPVILGSLVTLMLCVVAFLSIGRDHVFFVVPADPPVPGAGLFSALGEKVYVAIGLVIGLVVGPAQAASRTLLVRLAPEGRVTQFFGLFALSGKVTSFMGPLLVAVVTTLFVSQKAGMAVLVVFFCVGALILSRVSVGNAAPP
jgi:UMF1 family MFS transporter